MEYRTDKKKLINPEKMNTTTLAFIGDGVYEVYVREYVIQSGETGADRLHTMAVRYVRAESQAMAIKTIFENLSTMEQAVTRRGKNRKIATKPKNVEPMTYKWATGFEALVGHLYLKGEIERMEEIIYSSMEVINAHYEKIVGGKTRKKLDRL